MKTLVIASRNKGKVAEYCRLLADLPFNVLSLADYPALPEIEEQGSTFAENALLKAETVARLTGELVLADDSGLEVDALGGRPGIYSARYSGPGATDAQNNLKLLAELSGLPDSQRSARFRAAIAIAGPGLTPRIAEGFCSGIIAHSPQGTGGFGYDPLFFVPEEGKTFAGMDEPEKNSCSHRARAFASAREILTNIVSRAGS
jgi:XTP/dITP diphosphohydrolase